MDSAKPKQLQKRTPSSLSFFMLQSSSKTMTKQQSIIKLILIVTLLTCFIQSQPVESHRLHHHHHHLHHILHHRHLNHYHINHNQQLSLARQPRTPVNTNTNANTKSFYSSSSSPKIITEYAYIISYEHYTVILPCEILNLPQDMHVIWQRGKRAPQTVLTIGRTQVVEHNYRVRVIAAPAVQDSDKVSFDVYRRRKGHGHHRNNNKSSSIEEAVDSESDSEDFVTLKKEKDESKSHSTRASTYSLLKSHHLMSNVNDTTSQLVTNNNLEIRKLQVRDSGWYECQLPTKPTQKNYVYLEVLAFPRIQLRVVGNKNRNNNGTVRGSDDQDGDLLMSSSSLSSSSSSSMLSKAVKHGDLVELVCSVTKLPKRYKLDWFYNGHKIISNESTTTSGFSKKHRGFQTVNTLKLVNVNSVENAGSYKCKYDKVETEFRLTVKSGEDDSLTSSTKKFYENFNLLSSATATARNDNNNRFRFLVSSSSSLLLFVFFALLS